MVSTEQIKQLRDATGISVMQCKKALEEAGGDEGKALVILRKKSGEAALKKADRTLGAGIVASYVHATGTAGAMVELFCETDFVAKNEDFKKMAYDIAMHITAANPEFLKTSDITEKDKENARAVFTEEAERSGKSSDIKDKILQGKMDAYFKEKVLLEQPFIKDSNNTIGGVIEQAIQKFGEKIELVKFARFSIL